MKTISQYPLVIGEILRRSGERGRLVRWFRRPRRNTSRTHVARRAKKRLILIQEDQAQGP